MVEVGLESEFRWEFGEAVVHVHLDAIVLTATLIRWLEGAAIGGACEGEELVETVTEAAKRTVGAIDRTVSPTSLATVGLVLADDLFRDFDNAVNDVADGAAELAGGCVGGSGRCLDVRRNKSGERDRWVASTI